MTLKTLIISSSGILLAVLVAALLTFQGVRRGTEVRDQRQESHIVHGLMQEIFSDLQDAETGQRGFLLTQDESYLSPYFVGREQYSMDLAELKRHALNGGERERLATLESAAEAKLALLDGLLQLARRGNFEEARAIVRKGQGKVLMDDIRDAFRSLIQAQEAQTNALERQLFADSRRGSLERSGLLILIFIAGLLATFTLARDHRARFKAEADLRAVNVHLDELVKTRTQELERALVLLQEKGVAQALREAEVIQLNVRLEASNKELEAFAYSVSHDLRAPIRHVDGFAGLLRKSMEGKLPEKAVRQLDVIQNAAKRMGALIDDLLTYSRLGRTELKRQPVPLGPLIEQLQEELASEGEGRVVRWDIGPLPTVPGDPTLLRVALQNLLANALKFTRHRPEAHIQVGSDPDSGVTLFVRDNGVGFDMQYGDKLFNVFSRLHRQDEFEGTGIGLANVARVVAKHDGRVWAESEVDHGATFFIALDGG